MIKNIEVQEFYIRIRGKSGTKSDSPEDYKNITLKITLLMTSQCEEGWRELLYSSEREFILPVRKVLTYCYSLQDEEEKLMEKRNKKPEKKEDRQ